MAVGAPGQEAGGSVLVYERRKGKWSHGATLAAPAGTEGAGFGVALALDGDLLVVGAPGADSARGVVYAFRRDPRSRQWSRRRRGGPRRGARAGCWAWRSPPREGGCSPAGPACSGARAAPPCCIAPDAGGGWSEEARLAPPSDSALAYGSSVLLGATDAFVGAPASRRLAGEVFAFRLEGGQWRPDGAGGAGRPPIR